MTWLVLLLLTFSDGSSIPGPVKNYVNSKDECVAVIKLWVDEMHKKYDGQKDPRPSTFLTGCVQIGNITG